MGPKIETRRERERSLKGTGCSHVHGGGNLIVLKLLTERDGEKEKEGPRKEKGTEVGRKKKVRFEAKYQYRSRIGLLERVSRSTQSKRDT